MHDPPETTPATTPAAGEAPDARPRVLIVDDDRFMVDVLVGAIRPEYRPMVAHSGEQALKAARATPAPDLILLDVVMPEMDGHAVCRQLQADEQTRAIPVIFLTAKSAVEDETRGLALGAVDYIAKPISPPIVRARIRTHLTLRQALRRLEEQNLALLEFDRVKNRFLGMAAHDLRNPLTFIRGMSELLQGTELPEEKKCKFLQSIHDVSHQMLTLVNDLLDVAAIESGHLDLELQSCDLAALVAERAEIVALGAREKGIVLVVEADAVPSLLLDPGRIGQVIDNLLTNAVKFSQPGTTVWVRTLVAADRVQVVVRDQGPGLSPEDLRRIFGAFQRLSARPTGNERSTGLGLSIAKKIVDAHGGELRVASVVGAGSTFTLAFAPVHPAA
ncbi:MAG: hybrid sensor histidine kinase/response regulator [Magnetococcales bacterium]|nr:hybrid sensor histidine kinase/response regulator [Magnetococcales bacterium]